MIFFPSALFIYDFFLTFGDEICLVWGRTPSLVSAVILCARYPAFIEQVCIIIQFAMWKYPVVASDDLDM